MSEWRIPLSGKESELSAPLTSSPYNSLASPKSEAIDQLFSHSHTFPERLDSSLTVSLAVPWPRWFHNLGGLAEPTPVSHNWNNSESHISPLLGWLDTACPAPRFWFRRSGMGQELAFLTGLQMIPLVLTPSSRSTGLELFITQKWLATKACYLTSCSASSSSLLDLTPNTHAIWSQRCSDFFYLFFSSIIPFILHICYFQRWPLSSKPQPTLCHPYYQQITSTLIYLF